MAGDGVWPGGMRRTVVGAVVALGVAITGCGTLDDPRAGDAAPAKGASVTEEVARGSSAVEPTSRPAAPTTSVISGKALRPEPTVAPPETAPETTAPAQEPSAVQRQGSPFRLETDEQFVPTCEKGYAFLDLSISILSLPRERSKEFYQGPIGSLRDSLADLAATDDAIVPLAAPVDELLQQAQIRIDQAQSYDHILEVGRRFVRESAPAGEQLTRHLMGRCPGLVAELPDDWDATVIEGLS